MKKKILVVDDLELMRDIVHKMIIEIGFDVVVAKDGQEALDMIPTFRPNLVISDIEMPRLDGIELALRILPGIPVILMTGDFEKNSSRLVELERENLKVERLLRKPFSKMDLAMTVMASLKID